MKMMKMVKEERCLGLSVCVSVGAAVGGLCCMMMNKYRCCHKRRIRHCLRKAGVIMYGAGTAMRTLAKQLG